MAFGVKGWLPRLNGITMPVIDGQILFDVVHRKMSSAGCIDG